MSTKMTREDLTKAVEEIVGRKLSDLQAQFAEGRKAWEKEQRDLFQAIGAAQRGDASQADPSKKGQRAACFIRCLVQSRGDLNRAADFANKLGQPEVAKALGEGTLAGGGALVPEDMSEEVVELLRARAVVRRMGTSTIPMTMGSLTLPYINAGASATYVGENTNITKTEPTFGQITLTARKLAAIVPVSWDLLRDTSGRADAIVRDDLVSAMAVREDLAFIRGSGVSAEPKGLLNWAPSGNKFNANATISTANTTTDLGTAIQKLMAGDIPFVKPGWLFSPRTYKYLTTARDTNSNLVFAPEMALQKTLLGFPFAVTTQIPENLGSGTDESEIYLVDFASCVIGESLALEVSVHDGAAYHDGTNVIAALSQDQVVVKTIARHDFGARQRGKEIAIIQQVKLGA